MCDASCLFLAILFWQTGGHLFSSTAKKQATCSSVMVVCFVAQLGRISALHLLAITSHNKNQWYQECTNTKTLALIVPCERWQYGLTNPIFLSVFYLVGCDMSLPICSCLHHLPNFAIYTVGGIGIVPVNRKVSLLRGLEDGRLYTTVAAVESTVHWYQWINDLNLRNHFLYPFSPCISTGCRPPCLYSKTIAIILGAMLMRTS